MGCRLKSAQAIFCRGALSYWDFSYIGMPDQICVSNFQRGGGQMPAQICVSNFQPGGAQLLGLFVNGDAGPNPPMRFSAGVAISYWDFS